MNLPITAAAAAVTLGFTLGVTPTGPERTDIVGSPAPLIGGSTWFNHIGAPINNETLKGRTVLLEMWATW